MTRDELLAIIDQAAREGWAELDLRGKKITELPPEIGQLISLMSLNLNWNRLTAVPPEVGHLSSLTRLDLDRNQLTAVPPEIGYLSRLEKLNLSSNQLTAIPPEIGKLSSLNSLNLRRNQLTAIPPEIGQLTLLTSLNLSDNQLPILPSTLQNLTRLNQLHLHGNSLALPPEILGNSRNPGSPQTILDAYFQASRPLREAKLLLVGEGDVGKTATINRLLHNRFSEARSKTIGVDIHQWECGIRNVERGMDEDSTLRANVWDFGGQEIYHATHQFFLTHRSLYLLVLDATKDEAANRLDYWLRHIQSFAGDAPIILVVNKTDQHRLALDERSLLLKYPTVRSPIQHISCKSGAGILELRQTIEKALAALPHVNDWIPVAWFAVKEKLAALGKDFLPYESYVDLCEAEGISHEAAQQTLARFLHDLGAALNFHNDRRLAGTHVLNPEWVTGGIYAILNEPALQEQGILRLDELDAILDRRRYPAHKHPFLLDIMGKFELAAPLAGGQHYLIPGLLPKERPPFDWPTDAPVALEYRYAILPAAILSRLMVRLHHHTWQPERGQPVRWRNGLGVARDGCRALIVADPEAARLTIALDGPAPHRRHLLAVIRTELSVIHSSFARLEAEEWLPIPGHPGKAIKYQTLLNAEARGITTYYDGDSDMDLDVRQLLDGIESEGMRRARQIQERLRRCHPAELNEIGIELGVSDEALAAAVNAKQPTDLMRLIEQKDRPGEWLLRLISRRSGGFTHVERQTIIQGDVTMGDDTFHMSGDFRGAMVNIKTKLENVAQTINNMPYADSSEKQALQALVEQLKAELEKATPELASEAEAIAQTTEALVEAASAEKPNKTMIEITGEGLKKAAENVAAVMPTVLTIATQIVATVSRIVGG